MSLMQALTFLLFLTLLYECSFVTHVHRLSWYCAATLIPDITMRPPANSPMCGSPSSKSTNTRRFSNSGFRRLDSARRQRTWKASWKACVVTPARLIRLGALCFIRWVRLGASSLTLADVQRHLETSCPPEPAVAAANIDAEVLKCWC